jgi:hypothetical protein
VRWHPGGWKLTDFDWHRPDQNAGFKVDAGDVRRIRQLIERYNSEILPEELRPASLAPPAASLSPNNGRRRQKPRFAHDHRADRLGPLKAETGVRFP